MSQGSTCCTQRCRCHVKWSSWFRRDRRSAPGGRCATSSPLWPWEPDRSVEHCTAMCRTEKAEGGGDGRDFQILPVFMMPMHIFPIACFFLFRFLVFASIARGWFLWILSSCRNPDSNLEVFSRFVCPSLPSTMGGLIFRLHPERQHLGGSPKIVALVVSGGQAWLYATSVLSTGETETTSLDCGGFGMKFLHFIFKWPEGELLTINLYEFIML